MQMVVFYHDKTCATTNEHFIILHSMCASHGLQSRNSVNFTGNWKLGKAMKSRWVEKRSVGRQSQTREEPTIWTMQRLTGWWGPAGEAGSRANNKINDGRVWFSWFPFRTLVSRMLAHPTKWYNSSKQNRWGPDTYLLTLNCWICFALTFCSSYWRGGKNSAS